MNKIRLAKLAEVLENFKTERKVLVALPGNGKVGAFNLQSWGEEGSTVCSTTACAVGTAALHPWFRAKGLKMVVEQACRCCPDSGTYEVEFQNQNSFDACARFFGISKSDATFLFSPLDYPDGRKGEKSVAKRIRYVIRGGEDRGLYAGLKG